MNTINEAIAAEPLRKLKRALLLINNPVTAQSSQERDQYTELQTKITTAGQKGNQLAGEVLSVKTETANEKINELLTKLKTAYPQNDEVAVMVLSLIGWNAAVSAGQTQEKNSSAAAIEPVGAVQQTAAVSAPVNDVAPANGMGVPTPVTNPQTQNMTTQFTPPPPPVQSAFASNTPPPPTPAQPSPAVNSMSPQGGMLAGQATSPQGSVTPIDSTSGVVGSVVNNNGSMMQPTSAYNYSGIPLSSRPMGYVSPQTRQEDVE